MSEAIKEIPLEELHPFPDHPFGVRDDESMAQTVESIREYGVLVPAIARPREDGGYAELKKVRDELRDVAVHTANYEELRDLAERDPRKEKEHGRE